MTFLDALLKSFYSGDLKLVCNLTWIAFFFFSLWTACMYLQQSLIFHGRYKQHLSHYAGWKRQQLPVEWKFNRGQLRRCCFSNCRLKLYTEIRLLKWDWMTASVWRLLLLYKSLELSDWRLHKRRRKNSSNSVFLMHFYTASSRQ